MDLQVSEEELNAVKLAVQLGRENILLLLNASERIIQNSEGDLKKQWEEKANGLTQELVAMERGMEKSGLLQDRIDVNGIRSISLEEERAIGNMIRHARNACEHEVHFYFLSDKEVDQEHVKALKQKGRDTLREVERGAWKLVNLGVVHERYQEEYYG